MSRHSLISKECTSVRTRGAATDSQINDNWPKDEGAHREGDTAQSGSTPAISGFEVPDGANVGAIASIASAFGDPARANMLAALSGGLPLNATTLAQVAGVTPQTASGHIAKLADLKIIAVERRGREHLHRICDPEVVALIGLLNRLGSRVSSKRKRSHRETTPSIRAARRCFDHIGGRLGTDLAVALGFIGNDQFNPPVLPAGSSMLAGLGLMTSGDAGRLPSYTMCEDWTEARPHIAGALGVEILQRCLEMDWLRLRADSRALIVTHQGRAGFKSLFGVSMS